MTPGASTGWGSPTREQLWAGGPERLGWQVGHELAVNPCGQEGQWDPGLPQEECGQQAKRGDLPSPKEATSGVLWPLLGSSVQGRQHAAGEGLAEAMRVMRGLELLL